MNASLSTFCCTFVQVPTGYMVTCSGSSMIAVYSCSLYSVLRMYHTYSVVVGDVVRSPDN